MKITPLIKAITLVGALAFSVPILASGFPECSDDKCNREREFVLQRVLLPLVQLGNLDDQSSIESLIANEKTRLNNKKINERGEIVWRWPRRELSQVSFLQSKELRVAISVELICIRRADVEKVFKEKWLVSQTPAQWFTKDRQSHPDRPHNGSMSFREGKPYRFSFSFVPSGCARSMNIFSE